MRRIRTRILTLLLGAGVAVIGACGGGDTSDPATGGQAAATPPDQTPGRAQDAPDVVPDLPADVPLPTADEADAEAAREIIEDNADEVLAALTRAIEAELDAG